jgi:hypothetical protein
MRVSKNKIIVLILSTNNSLYDNFIKSIRGGWVNELNKHGIEYFFYSGGHSISQVIGDEIHLTAPDDLKHTSLKFIKCLELLLAYRSDVELIYRTNLSSFIDVKNFIKFISINNLNTGTYTGRIGKTNYLKEHAYASKFLLKFFSVIHFGNNIVFASGSGFFIGRDFFTELLNAKKRNLWYVDDVMVALTLKVMPDANVSPLRFDIDDNSNHKVSIEKYTFLIAEKLLFHYRFKTSNRSKDAKMLGSFSNENYRKSICVKNI